MTINPGFVALVLAALAYDFGLVGLGVVATLGMIFQAFDN